MISALRYPGSRTIHARILHPGFGPRTLCGRYGDPPGGYFDLTRKAVSRVTCRACRKRLP